jgi:hypothetical protein
MRKLSFPLIGIAMIVFACSKQDAKTPEEPLATEQQTGQRQCASDEVLQQQIAADPARAARLEELERKTELYRTSSGNSLRSGVTLYIPVVVNVVLPDANKVTDAHINSQIAVLNADFNGTNSELSNSGVYLAGYPYANVAKCNIEFYISDAANDINRKSTSNPATFGTNDAVKRTSSGGLDPESPGTKMNMWVCDLSSGYLGYAQFPGGSLATDGIVIDYQAFGTRATANYAMYSVFDLGRTATHEVGHWINLRHIWGDRRCGTDYVDDTPFHDESNGGCPAVGLQSRCSGKPLEQWMNYMDYTDDRCMYMFSGGQKGRMDAALDLSRKAWATTAKI